MSNYVLVRYCRCKLPGVENDTYELQGNYHQALINATIPAGSEDHEYDECHIYAYEEPSNYKIGNKPVNGTKVKCTAWVYDTTVYKNTFAKKVSIFYLEMFVKILGSMKSAPGSFSFEIANISISEGSVSPGYLEVVTAVVVPRGVSRTSLRTSI